jgi:hypothetical protein
MRGAQGSPPYCRGRPQGPGNGGHRHGRRRRVRGYDDRRDDHRGRGRGRRLRLPLAREPGELAHDQRNPDEASLRGARTEDPGARPRRDCHPALVGREDDRVLGRDAPRQADVCRARTDAEGVRLSLFFGDEVVPARARAEPGDRPKIGRSRNWKRFPRKTATRLSYSPAAETASRPPLSDAISRGNSRSPRRTRYGLARARSSCDRSARRQTVDPHRRI